MTFIKKMMKNVCKRMEEMVESYNDLFEKKNDKNLFKNINMNNENNMRIKELKLFEKNYFNNFYIFSKKELLLYENHTRLWQREDVKSIYNNIVNHETIYGSDKCNLLEKWIMAYNDYIATNDLNKCKLNYVEDEWIVSTSHFVAGGGLFQLPEDLWTRDIKCKMKVKKKVNLNCSNY